MKLRNILSAGVALVALMAGIGSADAAQVLYAGSGFMVGQQSFEDSFSVSGPGTLTVTYELRAASVDEITCPQCAERIKAAALVCRFCGHKFAPEEIENCPSVMWD